MGTLTALAGCVHPAERRGDEALARGEPAQAVEAYSEALESEALLRGEAERVDGKRLDARSRTVRSMAATLESASDDELVSRFFFIVGPFVEAAGTVGTTELESALAQVVPLVARRRQVLAGHMGDVLSLRGLAYNRGLSAPVLHGLDAVLVDAVVGLKNGAGKPAKILELQRTLHERGGLDADVARLAAALVESAEKAYPEVEKTALTRPSQAVFDAVAIIAVLPAGHPLRARAQALRDRLAQVHLDLAAKLPDNPGARLLHFGFAYVLSGRKPEGLEVARREVEGQVGMQWNVKATASQPECAAIAEALKAAFGYSGASNAPLAGSVDLQVVSCGGTVTDEREEKQVAVGTRTLSGGGTRAGGCVDANGSPAGCESSGTVYQTTVTTAAVSVTDYKTVVRTFRKREFTLGATAVARLGGARNELSLGSTQSLETDYPEFAGESAILAAEEENGRKTFASTFRQVGSKSVPDAMADEAIRQARGKVRGVTAPLVAAQAAQTLSRYKATGGQGTPGEDAYMQARYFNGKMTEEDTAPIAQRYGMTHGDVKEGVYAYVPPDLGPPVFGPRGGLLTASDGPRASGSTFPDSRLLDARLGTYGNFTVALMQMRLENVLVDPDRDALHLRVSGSIPAFSLHDFTGSFRLDDGLVLAAGLGRQGEAGARIDTSEYSREAAAGYRLLLGVGSETYSLLAGAEIHARFLHMGVTLGDFVAPLAVKIRYRLGGRGFVQLSAWGFNSLGETDTVGAELLLPFGRSAWGLFARAEQWKTPVSSTLPYASDDALDEFETTSTYNAGRQVTTMIGGGLGHAF